MNVKKYTATTMEAALAQVKSELGRDAVILHTRCFRKGALFGLGGSPVVEVTASDQVRVSPRSVETMPVRPIDRAYKGASSSNASEFLAMKGDIANMRALLEDILKNTRTSRTSLWPESLRRWHSHLVKHGADEELAAALLEPLAARFADSQPQPPGGVEKAVLKRITECVKIAPPIPIGAPGAPSVVAFVGPTGVGKTTTIAKLAAQFALRQRAPVGLITLDTYRIAAVEQLRTYARIIDVPLEVVLSPAEMADALDRLSSCSLILVDTAGRSQRDTLKINDLKGFFQRKRPDQTQLVISATAESETIKDVVDKFSVYRPNRVLITKLDELPAYGKLLDISSVVAQPVSYITTGQDVPDDIETACPQRFASLIAGEVSLDD